VKILIADDNLFYRSMLEATLVEWGYEVLVASDGEEAWQMLQPRDAPQLAILDWMMPRLDGLEVCRRLRALKRPVPSYLILLTAKGGKENLVTGLQNGADDFIAKPFDREELSARLQAGFRIVGLQAALAARVQQLEHALSAAQKLEIMGRLAGGVAHDFNNLLTVILGGCDILQSSVRDHPQQASMVQMVTKAGERGAALTRQLLAFSRGQMLSPTVLDLNHIITGGCGLLRRLIPEDTTIRTELDKSVGRIRADAGQIDQVLMNLVVNSRDAMPDGGTITIATVGVELKESLPGIPGPVPPGHYVVCRVSDTGCGMAPEIQARAFEPFFTTKENGKGTGLGLATVWGVVKQSEGFIQVESQPGVGTTFSLWFPRVTASPSATVVTPRQPLQAGGRRTVLLVEDESEVRAITRQTLTNAQYTVLEAHDGEEAVNLSRRWPDPIHLLLTDVVMPRMNGRQLVDRLASQRPHMRVLFMSGYTQEALSERAVSETAGQYLEKPFTPEQLLGRVRDALQN
jgi:DNA-binding response OmpR family regulator